jgi:hypothetical protein
MYLAVSTRPDLFVVSCLSKFLEKPSIEHWKNARRILKYLFGTINFGLKLNASEFIDNQIVAYSDVDYGTCTDTRKSISCVVLIFNDGPIIWFSRKQSIVATSTTEAEYIAAHDAAKETV